MKQKTVLKMLSLVIAELRSNGQWGTAHIYQSAHNSFSLFNNGKDIAFSELTPALMKSYEIFLRNRGNSWNTVATYMKVLKSLYNRALEAGDAPHIPRLFDHVRTTACSECKKALEISDMRSVLQNGTEVCSSGSLLYNKEEVSALFTLMFLLRGIPFVDLAYLKKSDIRGNTLYYRRRKTGRPMVVELVPEAQDIIAILGDKRPDYPYLLPILNSPEGTEAAYREYQSALRKFNRRLSLLAESTLQNVPLSTYSARHSWATLAYHCEIHPGIISEAMGHSSITVTETYLKPFRNEKINAANLQLIAFIKGNKLP
ncbi:MAG: site-specific integrase [Bacteroides sp.]|nr:site-specific integrase [Bacteroides sp.]